MNKNEILDILIKEVKKNCRKYVGEIKATDNLINDIGMTSLDIMIFLPRLEEVFNIEFGIRDLQKLSSIDDFALYIESKIANK